MGELRRGPLGSLTAFWRESLEAMGERPPPAGVVSFEMVRQFVYNEPWWKFYRLTEALVMVAVDKPAVIRRIDELFTRENLPYAMTPTGIDWRYSAPARQAIDEAERLLNATPELRGPAQQWQKAQGHLSKLPPDPENCVKDAIGALEGVARIISGRERDILSKILPELAPSMGMSALLKSAVDKLYAYRGDEQGVAHGLTGQSVDLAAEAEMVLHWTAATITYFVRKKSRGRE